MLRLIAARLAVTLAALLGVSVVIFVLLHVLPGDPLAGLVGSEATEAERSELARELGLSDPLAEQYGRWLVNVVRGDLGESLARRRPVVELVAAAYQNTVVLAGAAAAIGLSVGLLLGTVGALNAGGWFDRLIALLAVLGLSVPSYWLAIVLIIVFSAGLRWLPATGMYGADAGLIDRLSHVIMPAVAASAVTIGLTARTTRASLIDTYGQDFVLTLRAMGLSKAQVLVHVAKNAAPPILTVAGLQVGYLLGGSVMVETIFSWPGLGQLMVQSIGARDLRVIQSVVLVIAVTFILVNLAIDLLQTVLNPRLRRAG